MSTPTSRNKIIARAQIAALCESHRARGERVVFTNGCFDILHAGHVALLETARSRGDFLVVGLNSDASVRRLKGATRPVNDENARAVVLAALEAVGAVCVFAEDTPVALIEEVRPQVHVKGGDYRADELPEAAAVRAGGGEIVIVPLEAGFSTTSTLEKLQAPTSAVLIIPARYGSTRFPGKPLAKLGGKAMIAHVAAAGLKTQAARPVLVATDDERIAAAVRAEFAPAEVEAVMTGADCATGTDRLAEVVRARLAHRIENERVIVVNIQGDEPFIAPRHVDALIEAMRADSQLPMATLATPLSPERTGDPNVVKVVRDRAGDALYFSRYPIPFERETNGFERLRHLGIYAYEANWLLQMAQLPPSPLEEAEKLEQLRALEAGARIGVLVVDEATPIAIDTPEDLARAEKYLAEQRR